MHRKSALEKPDNEFLAQANTINDQCTKNATAWGLDARRLQALNTLTVNANTTYALNIDRSTRNHTTATNKKAAFSELKHDLSLFIDYLEGNLAVPDEALAIMGLRPRVRTASQPLPPPDEQTVLTVVRLHNQITLYASRIEHGQPVKGVKVKPFHGVKFRWRFQGETRYHIEVTTRLHITLHFEQEEVGKFIEVSAAWMNPRLQEGPWCEDITEVVG
jgi:hypothetical protein